jgi:anti-sigma regulatory factor (Ser/Thr protein kinase)
MVANIIIHGYHDRPGVIEIEIGSVGDSLMVCLRDQAPPFDPTRVLAPDITLPLEKRPLGGLGIHLARHFTDAMSHRVMPQGGNELTLVKQGVVRNDPKEETGALDN